MMPKPNTVAAVEIAACVVAALASVLSSAAQAQTSGQKTSTSPSVATEGPRVTTTPTPMLEGPRVSTSPAPTPEGPRVSTPPAATPAADASVGAAAAAQAAGQTAGAQSATRRGANDRLDLDTTVVTGNRELPKVLYIVPWKKADIGELPGQPFNTLLDEALEPVDRDVFRREVTYYGAVAAGVGASGAEAGGSEK